VSRKANSAIGAAVCCWFRC